MVMQKTLLIERTQTGEFVAPRAEFVLVDDWDEEDAKSSSRGRQWWKNRVLGNLWRPP